jgi:hypothetical protein
MLKRTSGGDNDTELNELTVAPIRVPSFVTVVTTATPVGKSPRASRKFRPVKVIWRTLFCGKQTRYQDPVKTDSGINQLYRPRWLMSAIGGKADIGACPSDVRS